VYAFYIMTDVYSTVMVAVFWTYTNDVVTRDEADKLYGPIGLGGILGGVVGGAGADLLARPIGPTNLLLICSMLAVCCGMLAVACERILAPPPRALAKESSRGSGLSTALDGAREVSKSKYLMLIVGILVAYEFASTMNDFAINVTFERAFHGDNTQLTKMYGRLGWVISATALFAQLVIVPAVLPRKRIALLLVPIAMIAAATGMLAVPFVATVFVLASSDNGLSYSVQQSTKETLYVPLSDAQKYKAKAFIDMFVQRAAKAVASFAFIGITAAIGLSLRASLALSMVALGIWVALAVILAKRYDAAVAKNKSVDAGESGTQEATFVRRMSLA
jgi:AAA family ATP:ADP antiporter